MKNNDLLLCKFVLTILVSLFMVFFLSKPAFAYPASPQDACCRAGIEQNFCTADTGNEWEHFTTINECQSWANTLNTYGYTCNIGEGSVGGNCEADGDRIRCRGGISWQVLNPSICESAEVQPTPTPVFIYPTPTPPVYYYPTPTPYYPPVYPIYPTPPPSYSYNPVCYISAQNYGSGVTAYINAQNAQYPINYYFNFNDGTGDLFSSMSSMTHNYTTSGYFTVTGYVTDGGWRSSARCSSNQFYIPGNIYPTPSPVVVFPQPTPVVVLIPQPQQPAQRIIVEGSRAEARAQTGQININVAGAGGQAQATKVAQLPKTGLPEGAWLLSSLLPVGVGLRRFGAGVKPLGHIGRYFWQKREFFRG
ncbi:hypothetical protein A2617_02590 [Candidatus Daviesbacteria bacterium RIFOXYD1_FULL_41_10]|uniref:PKD domain-containing protein n=1 Tax=Candidatus Daviesbacteria bacterium RIFOXYD1_FULL_41_10 TaxID=1797801 RepID=A0A1F5N0D1_9BACT|nr:MAG: hypothetical protein A2617_02590 [Candidatus Daviesbacteria bacterium RIFOXYD1_FULL_41_10]